MTQKISSVNIEAATLSSFSGPTISSVAIANSTYVILDDTAVSNAGGYAVITGTNFASGAQVLFGSTSATAVSFVDSTRLNVQVPALTAGSYVMYVQNPDGSTAIRLNGITSSPIPVWATGSTLTPQVESVPISISLSASSDSSVTYALANGSSLPSGTTLASNGLFSGTVTGLTSDTTYNFTVNAIDAENQETLRAFSVTVTAGDQNFKDTVLLLNGETSNNTWITDLSANTYALTVNGDARPVAFSPYETVWSNLFDGTDDYLTVASNTAFDFPGDFTIECWVYFNTLSGNRLVVDRWSTGVTGSYQLYWRGTGTSMTFLVNSSTVLLQDPSTTRIATNQWYHIAVVRSGSGSNNTTMYINGVAVVSATFTGDLTTTNTLALGIQSTTGTNDLDGYISNFRMLKGTALYTSNFTPSTSPLTVIANTSILTCQSNRLIDNGTNNFTITKSGNVTVSNFGPFTETDITTGSGYFDGTGDSLTFAGDNSLVLDGDFTIEFFMYLNSLTTSATISNNLGSFTTNAFAIIINHGTAANKISFWAQNINASAFLIASSSTVTTGQWYHVSFVRNSGVIRLYLNGVEEGSSTTSGTITLNANGAFRIGTYWGGTLNGYLSNLRILKGTSVYTGNFIPPNQPLTISGSSTIYANTSNVNTTFSSANTSLLTLQSRIGENNNRFVDGSGLNNIITRNGNATQGTFSPYQRGGWSNFFDGTGDYLSTSLNAAFQYGSGDFTLESWVNVTSFISGAGPTFGLNTIYAAGDGDASTDLRLFIAKNSTLSGYTTDGLYISVAGSAIASGSFTFQVGIWYHIAVTRTGGNVRIFVNGSLLSTTAYAGTIPNPTSFGPSIGATIYRSNPLYTFNGYISNFRMLKGTALYTSNFTAPTLPLTAVANTSLLTCADNGFIDESPNNFTLTRNGDVSVQPFSPFKTHTIVPNTHSVYFDGTGDYLTIPYSTSLFDWWTSDYTLEAWVYPTTFTGWSYTEVSDIHPTLIGNRAFNSTSDFWSFGLSTTGTVRFYYWNGSPNQLGSSATATLNQWNHIAMTKTSSGIRLFVNGVGTSVTGINGTPQSGTGVPLTIGAGNNSYINGYVSNLRILKGTALYTSDFTTPTPPLTVVANTTLLTCSSNTIVDLSTANTGNTAHAITVNGDARPTTVNPNGFTVTNVTGTSAEYSIANEGGSMYFDGTGDYLNTGTNSQLTFGTRNLTVECWIYQTATSVATYRVIVTDNVYGSTGGWVLYSFNNQLNLWKGGTELIAPSGSLRLNSWNHVAWTRSGSSNRIFINGIQVGSTSTDSTNYTSTAVFVGISAAATLPFLGYISGVRINNGTALYTSNFIPPAAPPTPIAGTTLLLNGTNGGIIDYTRKNNLETVGDVRIRNNITKYGNTSMFFDGTGDYLISNAGTTDLYAFGSGDFTIEMWINFAVVGSSGIYTLYDSRPNGSQGAYASIALDRSTAKIYYYVSSAIRITGSVTIAANTWYHVAICRSGTSTRLFVNGTQDGSTWTDSTTYLNPANRPVIAASGSSLGTEATNGYIDDLRITKGVARYTSNFTAPTAPLPIR